MSRIYPQSIPAQIASDPKRRAEIQVFEALQRLPDAFHVFYNCDWVDLSGNSFREDGEADFIVAHEKFGFIVLEVKGGVVSREENSRKWFSRSRNGSIFEIKNPVEQAKVSKHVILNKLKAELGPKLNFIRTRHAVVLPDSGRPKTVSPLGADMPLDLFMFMEDMSKLEEKVIKTLLFDPVGSNTKFGPLGATGLQAMIDMFAKGFKLEPSLLSQISSCEFKITQNTIQLKGSLKAMEQNQQLRISGGAGTGKTTLAIEKALTLEKLGQKILLLCFNAPLAAHLKKATEGKNISTSTFHQFCLRAIKMADLPDPDLSDPQAWNDLHYSILEALDKQTDIKYDAIIVDEGQDFKIEWLECLKECLNDTKRGLYYIFYDDNQQIYQKISLELNEFIPSHYRLYQNMRNTRPIFQLSKYFYSGGDIESLGPEGIDIDWVDAGKDSQVALEKTLNRLVNSEAINPAEIAVLTSISIKHYEGFRLKHHTFSRAEEVDTTEVVLDSIYRFKGLEKQVIILIDLSRSLNNKQLLYVGLSRARNHLIVIDDAATVDYLKECLVSARSL